MSGMSGVSGVSGGFFAELERQLVDVASAPLSADRAMPARGRSRTGGSPRRSSLSLSTRILRSTGALAVGAVALIAVAIALLPGGGRAPTAKSHVRAASLRASGSHRLVSLRVGTLPGVLKSGRIEGAVAAWEGRACSGCYVTDEASLRGITRRSLTPVRSIALHVGGGNLKRVCVWVIALDGAPAEGSTCSTNAIATVSGLHAGEDAVLTEGSTASDEEVSLAGGT